MTKYTRKLLFAEANRIDNLSQDDFDAAADDLAIRTGYPFNRLLRTSSMRMVDVAMPVIDELTGNAP